MLAEAGLIGIPWPREHGGQGGTLVQQAIAGQEFARARIPPLINHIGIGMCGPTVIAHGSEDQKQRYLARLLRADDVWCQLFSEPASGSDLAGAAHHRRPGRRRWVVNGQKVWTTLAHVADFGILLTRTDPDRPKHAGLTMFVVDMHAPGSPCGRCGRWRAGRASTRSSSTTSASPTASGSASPARAGGSR